MTARFEKAFAAFADGRLSSEELVSAVERSLPHDKEGLEQVLASIDEQTRIFAVPADVEATLRRRVSTVLGILPEAHESLPAERASERAAGSSSPLASDDATQLRPLRAAALAKGSIIANRFVLEEKLGGGGMGDVFKALDLRRQEARDRQPYVAVKVLKDSFRQHPAAFIALQRETQKALSLSHPNIVRVFDFDRDGDTIFMTMEYLSGQSLEQIIKAPDFAGLVSEKAIGIVSAAGSALAFAHQNRILHADFKPSNVFITDQGQIKVIDFGIARALGRGEPGSDPTLFDVSELGALTPAYASPEMIEGREPDERDDVYSLACVTYELLTGQHPYRRMPATTAQARGVVLTRPKGLDRRQWTGLQSALALERDRRKPSVAAFVAALSPARTTRVGPATLAAGILTAIVLAGGSYYYHHYYFIHDQEKPRTLADVIAAVPCSLLISTADDRSISVTGYAGRPSDVQSMEEALRRLSGSKTVSANILQWIDLQFCAPINLFKPAFTDNLKQETGLRVQLPQTGMVLRDSETLPLTITTGAEPAYISVDYFAVDGAVFHLIQNAAGAAPRPPRSTFSMTEGDGAWKVRAPYGTQLIIAFATTKPAFAAPRNAREESAEYLQVLEEALKDQSHNQSGLVLADFEFVRVEPRF